MTPTFLLLNLIASVCLFLYGIRQVRRGIMRGFGGGLRQFVMVCTRNRITGFLAGMASTLVLQSGGAVTLILATFVGQKILTTAAALAVVMGADVGVALVAQVLTFDISWLGPLVLLVGFVVLTSFEGRKSVQNIGLTIFGLGLMLMALGFIREAGLPIKEADALPYLLKPIEQDPIFAILVGALMTWMLHSSLAFVMLVVSFSSVGAVSFNLAFDLILGANIGLVFIPLMATIRDEPTAVRLPFANLLMRLIVVLMVLPYAPFVQDVVKDFGGDTARQLVHAHLGFSVLVAALFLPFTAFIARLVHKLIPDRLVDDAAAVPLYLDYKQMETPVVALSAAARETLRVADLVQDMLEKSLQVFKTNSSSLIKKIQDQDTVVDTLHRALKHYMAKLMELSMTPGEAARTQQIINFATTLEHVGDAIDKSMMPMASRMARRNHKFSDAGMKEIENLFKMVIDSMRLAQTVFMSSDQKLARELVEGKQAVNRAERKASANHFARLSQGVPESIESSSVHLDLLRDLQRINGDLVTVAYPILEATGELLPNRLTSPKLKSLEPDMREEG